MEKKTTILITAVLVLATALVATTMSSEEDELRKEIQQQQVLLYDYEDALSAQTEELEAHKDFIRVLRGQSNQSAYSLSNIESMVAQATQTITDIKKLEEADKELLAKYSKVFFLNEHYTPSKLVAIPSAYTASDRTLQIEELILPFAINMLNDMESNGLSPKTVSAFRSFSYQEDLKHRNTVIYGEGTANQFVADQGYSEHQLGTTIDISNAKNGGELSLFESTPEYTWLVQNAHKYGFILSYPKDNAYYAFEPWHWRFVGVELATYLHKEGKHFYDLPQREIDADRLKMFEVQN